MVSSTRGRSAPNHPPGELHWRYRVVRWVYNLILAAALPLVFAWVGWRTTFGGKPRYGFMQRLGLLPQEVMRCWSRDASTSIVWVHAVSVGEVSVSQAVVREMIRRDPAVRIVMSVTTATGYRVAQEKLPEGCALFYLPMDLPICVKAALSAVRPDMLLLMETELWPNLLDAAHAMGIRTLVCNGRVSDRSYARAHHVRWFYGWVLHCVDRVYAQSEQDAERFRGLGAEPDAVSVTGSCKFDEEFPEVTPQDATALRGEYGFTPDQLVWVNGSTGPGEDAILLDAFVTLRRKWPQLRLLHAPRHPERADQVADLARDRGLSVLRRTEMLQGTEAPMGHDSIVLLDTVGELTRLYAIGDVVFVGRSLVPLGGGNVLQPLHYGKPVVVGRHTTNFRDTVRIAKSAGVVTEVRDQAELVEEVDRLLRSDEARRSIASKAAAVFREHRGASARTADGAIEFLHEDDHVA
ncbi:MAG: 3-deoxy-D-manno-octulosonic acid transferase [Armatimonadia bacterium]|nr:3-deoxy-D-manno-octulosonic acid transferase [Armatimonadia bacterium]